MSFIFSLLIEKTLFGGSLLRELTSTILYLDTEDHFSGVSLQLYTL